MKVKVFRLVKMEMESFSEKLGTTYQSTKYHNPQTILILPDVKI
jgi:hypothetical protein